MRGARRAACVWCARRRASAQLNDHDHGRPGRGRADRRRAVRLAGLGARGVRPRRRRQRGLGQQRPLRADRDARHGVAADAGRRRSTSSSGALLDVDYLVDRHAHRGYGRTTSRPCSSSSTCCAASRCTGFRLQAGRADLRESGAPHLRHDLRGAHGHPGRVQHADRVHQRGAARPTTRKLFRLIVVGRRRRERAARSPSRRSR